VVNFVEPRSDHIINNIRGSVPRVLLHRVHNQPHRKRQDAVVLLYRLVIKVRHTVVDQKLIVHSQKAHGLVVERSANKFAKPERDRKGVSKSNDSGVANAERDRYLSFHERD